MESVIVAIISGASALIVSVVTNLMSASSTRKLLEYRMLQMESKVDKIETKVDKHNEVQDRVMLLEYDLKNIKERLKGDDGK